MKEANDNRPPKIGDVREDGTIDYVKRRREILAERVKKEFSNEIEEILNTVRTHLTRVDRMTNATEVETEIKLIVDAISVKAAEFVDEGIPVKQFEKIGGELHLAEGFAKVAASLQREGKTPDTYSASLREAKDTIFAAAIILYDELQAARLSNGG
ncbi:MAG: hypothetical protein G01um10148_758 [Parcubacteria group bacterium Gr01-1014_8]|nr:MAG: hypothetical protein G01um10148_758 [Parcubacteria group bacterium Gr01-1014_8]